jgi:RimJ/RimL family protein N-acetyltransferase
MSKFLDGKQIYLRPFTKSDIPTWYDWFNSQELTEHMNKGAFPNTEEAQEEFYNQLVKSKNDVQLAIILKKDDSLVGIVGIHKIDWIHRHGDVSIFVGDTKLRGKGIGTEAISLIVRHAFNKLNLHKLTAGMSSLNVGARKSFEKNGFIIEGNLRENFFYKGSYVDQIAMGLLREEWERSQGN